MPRRERKDFRGREGVSRSWKKIYKNGVILRKDAASDRVSVIVAGIGKKKAAVHLARN